MEDSYSLDEDINSGDTYDELEHQIHSLEKDRSRGWSRRQFLGREERKIRSYFATREKDERHSPYETYRPEPEGVWTPTRRPYGSWSTKVSNPEESKNEKRLRTAKEKAELNHQRKLAKRFFCMRRQRSPASSRPHKTGNGKFKGCFYCFGKVARRLMERKTVYRYDLNPKFMDNENEDEV